MPIIADRNRTDRETREKNVPLTEAEFSRQLAITLPQIRPFARKLTESFSEADDLMQDTAVLALANQNKYEDRGNMAAWLVTTMKFRQIARHQKAVTRSVLDARYVDQREARVFTDPGDVGITLKRVVAFMGTMPPNHAQVLTLDALGNTQDEMAIEAACKLGTVKSRLSRARAALREEFGEI